MLKKQFPDHFNKSNFDRMEEKQENQPTPLGDLGEFGLIKHLTSNIQLKQKSSLLGIGDDAAILAPDKKCKLISTDMLIEGVHFDLLYTPLKHLGYKAAIVNFSDIYAMNAYPEQITVSLALSNKYSVEAIEEIYEGILLACELYHVDLIGGDTTSSLSGLVISISVVGSQEEKKIVKRSGAKEDDLICVSGDLGAAFAGLQILEREKSIFESNDKIQPDLSGKDYILERQLKPEARRDVIQALNEKKIIPNSMIDISDGLSSELLHLAEASKVGIQIYEDHHLYRSLNWE
jgi:thiamine-monophosphate kinase